MFIYVYIYLSRDTVVSRASSSRVARDGPCIFKAIAHKKT